MSINKIVIGLLFIPIIAFSQTKKVPDTIVVHEKVFVYKTLTKRQPSAELIIDSIFKAKNLTIKSNKYKFTDTILLKKIVDPIKKETKPRKTIFSIDSYGISTQFLMSKQYELSSYGAGLGLFITKKLYKKLFLDFEVMYSKIYSKSNVDETFDGYYITPQAVLYYVPKNIETQQITIPISLYWKIGKINPIIGVNFTQKKTQLDFFSYPNNTTLTTIQTESHQLSNNYIDFVYGFKIEATKRFYAIIRSKQTISKFNSTTVFESIKQLENLHFFPNQITLGVYYKFKK